MNDWKLPTITQEFFNQVESLVESAKWCSSLKEAQQYIEQIISMRNYTHGRCCDKMTDVISEVSEYCKKNSDKDFHGMLLRNAMHVLETMIEEKEDS